MSDFPLFLRVCMFFSVLLSYSNIHERWENLESCGNMPAA